MKPLLLALMLAPVASFAAGPGGPGGPRGPGADPADKRDHMEKRMHIALVLGIAEALDLNEAEGLRMADRIRSFEDKRKPLRTEMADSMKVLRDAATGDQAALGQVDQATARLLDNRAKLAVLDKDMFAALSKDLTPQRRAQLALFLANFQRHAKGGPGMGMGGMGRGRGMGRGMGPGAMGPGGGWGGRFDQVEQGLDD